MWPLFYHINIWNWSISKEGNPFLLNCKTTPNRIANVDCQFGFWCCKALYFRQFNSNVYFSRPLISNKFIKFQQKQQKHKNTKNKKTKKQKNKKTKKQKNKTKKTIKNSISLIIFSAVIGCQVFRWLSFLHWAW